MKVININTREVLYDDGPTRFAVYVIVVEDSNKALEAISSLPGLVDWRGVESDMSEDSAIALASELESPRN